MGDGTPIAADSPVYPLYRALLTTVGVTDADLDVGVYPRDPQNVLRLGPRQGAGDGVLTEAEILTFTAEHAETLRDVIEGSFGVPPRGMNAKRKDATRDFLLHLREITQSTYDDIDGRAAEAMAYGLFMFYQFPSIERWSELSGPRAQQRFLPTYFPEATVLGLTPLRAYLETHGGLEGISFGYYRSWGVSLYEPTDYTHVQTNISFFGGSMEQMELGQLFQLAGLQVFYAEVFVSRDPFNPCSYEQLAYPAVGVHFDNQLRLFVPGTPNLTNAERFQWIELSATDLFLQYTDPFLQYIVSKMSQNSSADVTLFTALARQSYSAATRVPEMLSFLAHTFPKMTPSDATAALLHYATRYPPFLLFFLWAVTGKLVYSDKSSIM
ncbi:MAG: hypothetical protein HYV02_08555 [Deltaproteobacteria bacterium]|nr:hypothetical protein [Deltaproteobacteria bacterium]